MLVFLDTEFTDFDDPGLISIGLVSECEQYEFYAERSDFDRSRCSDFVRSVVLPKLGKAQLGPGCLDRDHLATALQEWLDRLHALKPNQVIRVLYDSPTDFDLFRRSLPDALPPWLEGCNVADELNPLTWASLQREDSPNAHHALEDARQLRSDWLGLRANH